MIYVDTSVIIAALDVKDPKREEAKKILEIHDDKAVSELVLIELASVLARQHKMLASIRNKLNLDEHVAFMAVILYIMKRFKLKYTIVGGFLRTPLGSFYKPLGYGIELAEMLKLRTLDLLHLAYIKSMKEQGILISTILTADKEFKDNEEDIKKIVGISVDLI